MSEYELSLLRQRGIAARDSKAQRGEYRFMLPPGFCWSEIGKIEIDPDEHPRAGQCPTGLFVATQADIRMPVVVLRNVEIYKLIWKAPAYHTVMQILHNPLYAGAYAFGRIAQKTRTAGPARSAGSGSRVRNGTSFCATIMPATSAGRTMRTIRNCCSRTRT